jgi:hypothetical protein
MTNGVNPESLNHSSAEHNINTSENNLCDIEGNLFVINV